MNKIEVFKLNNEAKLPSRNKATDCGLDLYSLENVFIPKGETKIVKTGVAIRVPDGYVGKIEDRSSMGSKGLRTGAGIIDPGYTGEIAIVMHNLTADPERDPVLFQNGYQIRKGDKVAQMLFYKIETPEPIQVETLWNSERGNKGYGSSGR